MTLDLRNNFESGQANNTAITTANSGGGAGNAWDSCSPGTGAAAVYTTTAIEGTLSGKFSVGATSTTSKAVWSTAMGGSYSRLQGGFDVEPNSLPASTVAVHRFTATGSQAARFAVSSAGAVSLRDKNSTVVVTSSGTMTTSDKWYVTYDITFGATASGDVWIYYSHASSTPDEHLTFSAADFLSTSINAVEFGVCASTTSVTVTVDNCRVTDQGVPGPPTVAGTMAATLGSLSAAATGHVIVHGTASAPLGGLAAAAAGRAVVHGTLTATLGGLTAAAAGTAIGASVVNGTMSAILGGLTASMAGTVATLVTGTAAANLGGLTATLSGRAVVHGSMSAGLGGLSASIVAVVPLYLFTPLQRKQTTVLEGALRVSHMVSSTVWKDDTGVWRSQEVPAAEVLAVAQRLLSVGGRPEYVTPELAEELATAGVGTITTIYP